MILDHDPFSDNEIISSMEDHGYNALNPAISPDKLHKECEDNPVLLKLYGQMIKQCQAYAHDVFSMMYEQKIIEEMRNRGENTREAMLELGEIDKIRHHSHESLIDSINILSRAFAKNGKDNSWMSEVVSGGRATYAVFALLTFYKMGVSVK